MNEQTAVNNYYQKVIDNLSSESVQSNALEEFDNFVNKLSDSGVEVIVIDDTEKPDTPDSIFPNNWISFHADGRIGLYPMFAENRRKERREDVIDILKAHGFEVKEIVDFTEFEEHDKFLEGTGSMILDRVNKIVYAALSERTDSKALDLFCEQFDYQAVTFNSNQSVGDQRLPIYHTNVMMCVAESFAIVCLNSIDDPTERANLQNAIEGSGKELIEISEEQINHFAGNMLQLQNKEGEKLLVMSNSAFQSLNNDQIKAIEAHCAIVHSSLDTIEACGGGSARCMMAEVFLPQAIN